MASSVARLLLVAMLALHASALSFNFQPAGDVEPDEPEPQPGDLKRVGSLYDPPPGYKDDLIVWDFFWTRVSGWDARAAVARLANKPADTSSSFKLRESEEVLTKQVKAAGQEVYGEARPDKRGNSVAAAAHAVGQAVGRIPGSALLGATACAAAAAAAAAVKTSVVRRAAVDRSSHEIDTATQPFSGSVCLGFAAHVGGVADANPADAAAAAEDFDTGREKEAGMAEEHPTDVGAAASAEEGSAGGAQLAFVVGIHRRLLSRGASASLGASPAVAHRVCLRIPPRHLASPMSLAS